jgi:predicted kinase
MAETDRTDVGSRATGGASDLVVVCGLPGVGKTTVAGAVADQLDARLLRTDVVRKDLFSDPEYTDEEERTVYRELFERARETVADGRPVVLDGTFHREEYRERATVLARALEVDAEMVTVECDTDVVRRRIRAREDDESDADFEVHCMFEETFDPIDRDHLTVDNTEGIDATRSQVDQHF